MDQATVDFIKWIAESSRKYQEEVALISPPKDKPMTMDTAVDYEQEIIRLKDELAELKREGYVLVPKGWIEVAKCPIPDCVDGAYHDTYGNPEQCQFCDEKQTFLKAV